jgi:hypothetical protein
LKKYLENMKIVADGYFHRIPSAEEYWRNRTFETKELSHILEWKIDWERACSNKKISGKPIGTYIRTIKFSPAGRINFDSNTGEVWIPWHRGIAAIVRDLLQNAVYANSTIHDPWNPGRNEFAHLWLLANYEKNHVELRLANGSTSDSSMVYQKLKKYRWSYLTELGGSIETADVPQKGMVEIRMRIPYAGSLAF